MLLKHWRTTSWTTFIVQNALKLKQVIQLMISQQVSVFIPIIQIAIYCRRKLHNEQFSVNPWMFMHMDILVLWHKVCKAQLISYTVIFNEKIEPPDVKFSISVRPRDHDCTIPTGTLVNMTILIIYLYIKRFSVLVLDRRIRLGTGRGVEVGYIWIAAELYTLVPRSA